MVRIWGFGNKMTAGEAPPSKIKQWTTGQDGLENLKLGEADLQGPKDGEVLVKVLCVALNYRDTEGLLAILCYDGTR